MFQKPDEVLDLISIVLVSQQLNEFRQPLSRVFSKFSSALTQPWRFRVQDIGGQKSSQVDDRLLC